MKSASAPLRLEAARKAFSSPAKVFRLGSDPAVFASNSSIPLLSLPRELRDKIWSYVTPDSATFDDLMASVERRFKKRTQRDETPNLVYTIQLICTCSQIRDEVANCVGQHTVLKMNADLFMEPLAQQVIKDICSDSNDIMAVLHGVKTCQIVDKVFMVNRNEAPRSPRRYASLDCTINVTRTNSKAQATIEVRRFNDGKPTSAVQDYAGEVLESCSEDAFSSYDGKVDNTAKLVLGLTNNLLEHQTYDHYMYHTDDIAMMPKGWGSR